MWAEIYLFIATQQSHPANCQVFTGVSVHSKQENILPHVNDSITLKAGSATELDCQECCGNTRVSAHTTKHCRLYVGVHHTTERTPLGHVPQLALERVLRCIMLLSYLFLYKREQGDDFVLSARPSALISPSTLLLLTCNRSTYVHSRCTTSSALLLLLFLLARVNF